MRLLAERFEVGDKVRAAEAGPTGMVVSKGAGWTIVRYPVKYARLRGEANAGMVPYKHGVDRLYELDDKRGMGR